MISPPSPTNESIKQFLALEITGSWKFKHDNKVHYFKLILYSEIISPSEKYEKHLGKWSTREAVAVLFFGDCNFLFDCLTSVIQ